MEFHGVTPVGAPDPSLASEGRLRAIPFPILQLTPQPTITRTPITGFTTGHDAAGLVQSSVQFTYTLWRYPDDHSDPRNEIELDEHPRWSIEKEPSWGRPAWLIEVAKLHKYPMLWEAVRTGWYRSLDHPEASLPAQLLHHTNHVLRNSFRQQLGIPSGPGGGDVWKARESAITPGAIVIDGHEHTGMQIDTAPLVYAIGLRVNEHVFCTVVLPGDALPFVELTLSLFPK